MNRRTFVSTSLGASALLALGKHPQPFPKGDPPVATKALPITGTFIDEITYDIPSQNWGPEQWRADFDAMKAIGIDTVIIIRCGLRGRTVFPSKVIGTDPGEDLARLYLEEAEKRKMHLFIGNYDSAEWGKPGAWKKEIEINREFMKEIWSRYGSFSSFAGWYLSHETSHSRFHFREITIELSELAKTLAPGKPVLISPYYPSRKLYGDDALEPDEFADNWRHMLKGITTIDFAAFQDGTAPLRELDSYLSQATTVLKESGIQVWNNVETFTREMPVKFPPIDFRELREKLAISAQYATKNITFEFSHFMSPNSFYPSAKNLYGRYKEFFNL
ncbi:MAG TPA: DUF4434 domain-containing protein [Bacteroidota bacterium]|nr:DUF4434 domain-containing protein [Bacteroidota bacterium]